MPVTGRLYGCPVELSLDLIGGKWKTVILARLKEGSLRYGELRRLIPGLSDKVLSQRLRELEEAGFVQRSTDPEGQTRYALTAHGLSLSPALTALYEWGASTASQVGARFRVTPQPTR